jgi:hypothetical protein
MLDHYPTQETLREHLERDLRAIHTLLADAQTGGQVLERLPNGELAWLRLNPRTVRIVEDQYAPLPDDTRYWITDPGRRALRELDLLGQPWPTVAEASA